MQEFEKLKSMILFLMIWFGSDFNKMISLSKTKSDLDVLAFTRIY